MGYFSGEVRKITFANSVQNFYIAQVELDTAEILGEKSPLWATTFPNKWVTAKGYFSGTNLEVGDWVAFEASWKNHEKYGPQLSVTRSPSPEALEVPQVCAGLVRYAGIRLRKEPVDKGWAEKLPSLLSLPRDLAVLLEISQEDAYRAYHLWESYHESFSVVDMLVTLGIPSARVGEVLSLFGEETEEIIKKDPWLLGRIQGIGFEDLEEVSRNLEDDLSESYERTRGAVRQCVVSSSGFGHLFISTGELVTSVTKLIGERPKEDIAKALKDLVEEGAIVVDNKTTPTKALYEKEKYFLEQECTQLLEVRVTEATLEDAEEHRKLLGKVSQEVRAAVEEGAELRQAAILAIVGEGQRIGYGFSQEQVQGVLSALTEPVSIISGLPGTGKTTSLSVLVSILIGMEIPILLVAPTAIAAKRMSSLTGHPAYTIHRAFGAKGGFEDGDKKGDAGYSGIKKRGKSLEKGANREWEFGKGANHPAKVVICDESSMLDQHLLYRILDGTGGKTRLVFVGDAAQLPSVGPGNVLRDMIKSQVFPVSALVQIFRQDGTSDIVEAAHQMHRGEMPEFSKEKRDFRILPASSEREAAELIVKIASKVFAKIIENKRNGERVGSFQVLSPRHRGDVGVTSLNEMLRKALNPRREERCEAKIGYDIVREGDRIMVVENNYEYEIYNGDLGKVSIIDRKKREMKIKIHGGVFPRYLTMSFQDVARYIRLAYACTVHKYQGLEVDLVIMPVLPSFGRQLQRNLFYTAITRARKKVILVGREDSLWKAIQNSREDHRNTLFAERLRKSLKGE